MTESKLKECESCGEIAVKSVMVDVDGTNLVEAEVCQNCQAGMPALI